MPSRLRRIPGLASKNGIKVLRGNTQAMQPFGPTSKLDLSQQRENEKAELALVEYGLNTRFPSPVYGVLTNEHAPMLNHLFGERGRLMPFWMYHSQNSLD